MFPQTNSFRELFFKRGSHVYTRTNTLKDRGFCIILWKYQGNALLEIELFALNIVNKFGKVVLKWR